MPNILLIISSPTYIDYIIWCKVNIHNLLIQPGLVLFSDDLFKINCIILVEGCWLQLFSSFVKVHVFLDDRLLPHQSVEKSFHQWAHWSNKKEQVSTSFGMNHTSYYQHIKSLLFDLPRSFFSQKIGAHELDTFLSDIPTLYMFLLNNIIITW